MRTMWKAVQAVTVELVGVVLVAWLLFGFTAFGVDRVSGPPTGLSVKLREQLASAKGALFLSNFQQGNEWYAR